MSLERRLGRVLVAIARARLGLIQLSALDSLMRFQILLIALMSVATSGCGPSQEARLRAYELREQHCIQQYRSGDIQTAKQALLDYLRLVEEEEASHLPFKKTAWTRAVTAVRLTLIYRRLGDTGLASQYLHEALVYARKDAQEEGKKTSLEKTDEQFETSLIDAVNKLDENTRPQWRIE
jgi:hypothetical protein